MGILGGQPAEKDKAELDLVAAFVDPVVSAGPISRRSSSQPRADAPTEFRDAHNQVAMDAMNKPNGAVKNPFNVITGDWNNGIWTAMYNFWSDKNLTTDDAVAELKACDPGCQLIDGRQGRTPNSPPTLLTATSALAPAGTMRLNRCPNDYPARSHPARGSRLRNSSQCPPMVWTRPCCSRPTR